MGREVTGAGIDLEATEPGRDPTEQTGLDDGPVGLVEPFAEVSERPRGLSVVAGVLDQGRGSSRAEQQSRAPGRLARGPHQREHSTTSPSQDTTAAPRRAEERRGEGGGEVSRRWPARRRRWPAPWTTTG